MAPLGDLSLSASSFIESTIRGFTRAVSASLLSERTANQPGFLQHFDPRVRVVGLLALVLAVVLCRKVEVVALLLLVASSIAVASGISLLLLAKRVWLVILAFTGLIALPALFITPGQPLLMLPATDVTISAQGLYSAILLIVRAETAATLTTTLVLCTPWAHLLRALRFLRLPGEVVAMLAMTHRYVFLLVETANQMFESRQSRTVGVLPRTEQRKMAARTAGVLLSKSMDLSQEVYLAMLSRGFRGETRLLTQFRLTARDYIGLTAFTFTGCLAVWIGR
jgi:cobalt/nickel transport system permease protein